MQRLKIATFVLFPFMTWAIHRDFLPDPKFSSFDMVSCGDVVVEGRVIQDGKRLFLKVNESSPTQFLVATNSEYSTVLRKKRNEKVKVRGYLKIKNNEPFLSFQPLGLPIKQIHKFVNPVADAHSAEEGKSITVLKSVFCR